jgi:hypothetical protein
VDRARVSDQPRWQVEPQIDALAYDGLVHRLDDGRVQPLAVPYALQTWTADQLQEAHHAVSRSLTPGSPARYRHVVAAGAADEIVAEALALAPELTRDGRTGDALAVLEMGLVAARDEIDVEGEEALLVEMAKTSLDDGSHSPLQRVLYEIGRATERTKRIARLDQLVQAARDVDTADASRVLRSLDELGRFDDWELELWRHAQRFRAAMEIGRRAEERVLSDVEEWGSSAAQPRVQASARAWRGVHLRNRGQAREAAELLQEASQRADRIPSRLANSTNAAIAYLSCGELHAARDAARSAVDLARERRSYLAEAYCEAVIRSVGYRLGELSEPDAELPQAVAALGDTALEAQTYLTEAAIAWRADRLEEGRELAAAADAACLRVGVDGLRVPARALALLCGASAETGELETLARAAEACPDAETAVQGFGLLALLDSDGAPRLRELARKLATTLLSSEPAQRRDVLSLSEATSGVA